LSIVFGQECYSGKLQRWRDANISFNGVSDWRSFCARLKKLQTLQQTGVLKAQDFGATSIAVYDGFYMPTVAFLANMDARKEGRYKASDSCNTLSAQVKKGPHLPMQPLLLCFAGLNR
jgi:hypothetical protein